MDSVFDNPGLKYNGNGMKGVKKSSKDGATKGGISHKNKVLNKPL